MIKDKGFVMVYPSVTQKSEYCGTAIFISYLIGKAIQCFGNQDERFFISERIEQMKETGLTKKRIEKAEKEAIDKGWIQKQKTKTCPSKNQILVCFSQIESIGSVGNVKTLHCGAHINPHVGAHINPHVGAHINPHVGAHINPHVGAHYLYIDKDIDKEVDTVAPSPSTENKKSDREKIDSFFSEFLEISRYPNYTFSETQICNGLFKGQLQVDLRQNNLTMEDFIRCAKIYYDDERPQDLTYITKPHNFISKQQNGERVKKWMDFIYKKQKCLIQNPRDYGELDKKFHAMLKESLSEKDYKADCDDIHLLGFDDKNRPNWGGLRRDGALTYHHVVICEILDQLKKEPSCQTNA